MNFIALYPETAFFYVGILAASFLFALLAFKSNKPFVFVILCALVFLLVAGLRAPSVGTDTRGYIDTFEALRNSMSWRVVSITEPGFLLLSRGLMIITGQFPSMLVCDCRFYYYFNG